MTRTPTEIYKRIKCRNEADWLAARENGIGGSDAACIVGLNPWKTNQQLWREKTGKETPEDISDKPAVQYGRNAESLLRSLFKLDFPEYDVQYHRWQILQNRKFPWLQASLDGELIEEATGRHGILEIKTTSISSSAQMAKWENRIPDNYYIQCLHYLLVTGWRFVILSAKLKMDFREPRSELRRYVIERDDEGVRDNLRSLLESEIAFQRCIEKDIEPPLIIQFGG